MLLAVIVFVSAVALPATVSDSLASITKLLQQELVGSQRLSNGRGGRVDQLQPKLSSTTSRLATGHAGLLRGRGHPMAASAAGPSFACLESWHETKDRTGCITTSHYVPAAIASPPPAISVATSADGAS